MDNSFLAYTQGIRKAEFLENISKGFGGKPYFGVDLFSGDLGHSGDAH